MKKFITVSLLFVTLTMFGQAKESKSLFDQGKQTVSEYVDSGKALKDVNTIQELFVHYFKEATEGSKKLVGNTVEVVGQVVTRLLKESTIVVEQFVIYTAITYLIPILFGLWLIFKLPKIVRKNLVIKTEDAEAFNKEIDDDEDENTYSKKTKKPSLFGRYFNDKISMIANSSVIYLAYGYGAYLMFINTMPFIKITFFTKLYLVEMLLKYI